MIRFKTFVKSKASNDDISKILNHHNSGLSHTEIFNLTNINPNVIRRVIKGKTLGKGMFSSGKPDKIQRYSISNPPKSTASTNPNKKNSGPKPVTISDDEAAHIFKLREKGHSELHIANKMGYPRATIRTKIDTTDASEKYKQAGIYHPPISYTKGFTSKQLQTAYKLRKTHSEFQISKILKKSPKTLEYLDSDENKKHPSYVPKKYPTEISDDLISHAYSLRKEKKYSRRQITGIISNKYGNEVGHALLHDTLDSEENKKRPDYVPHYNIEVKYLGRGKWGRKNP